jgi:hypothetical protein
MRRGILMTPMAIRIMKVIMAHRAILACWRVCSAVGHWRLFQDKQMSRALRQPLVCRAREMKYGSCTTYSPELPRRRAPDLEAELPRIRANNCSAPSQFSRQQRAQSVCDPAKSVPIPECCTNVHPELFHVPPLGSAAVIRALRSALHTHHSMVRDCCAAKVQKMTRRRLQMLQGRHHPGLCPLPTEA